MLSLFGRRPGSPFGRQVTPASAFSQHRPNGGRERDFRPEGCSLRTRRRRIWERIWSPTSLRFGAETRSSPPLLERGLLVWTRPLSLGQVCRPHLGLRQGRPVHPLLSRSRPSGRGTGSKDSWSVTPFGLEDLEQQKSVGDFRISQSHPRSTGASRGCPWVYVYVVGICYYL